MKMKKVISLVLSAAMAASLCGCLGGSNAARPQQRAVLPEALQQPVRRRRRQQPRRKSIPQTL